MKKNEKVETKIISRKILKPDYNNNFCDCQLCKDIKVERSGFIPRSIQIRKMAVAGELNKIMQDYENNRLLGSTDDLNVPLPILNIKGLDRVEVIKAVRNRGLRYSESLDKQLEPIQKRQAELETALDFYHKFKDKVDVKVDVEKTTETP